MIGPTRPWGPEVIRLIDEHVGRRLKERRVTLRITRVDMERFLNVPKDILEAYETSQSRRVISIRSPRPSKSEQDISTRASINVSAPP